MEFSSNELSLFTQSRELQEATRTIRTIVNHKNKITSGASSGGATTTMSTMPDDSKSAATRAFEAYKMNKSQSCWLNKQEQKLQQDGTMRDDGDIKNNQLCERKDEFNSQLQSTKIYSSFEQSRWHPQQDHSGTGRSKVAELLRAQRREADSLASAEPKRREHHGQSQRPMSAPTTLSSNRHVSFSFSPSVSNQNSTNGTPSTTSSFLYSSSILAQQRQRQEQRLLSHATQVLASGTASPLFPHRVQKFERHSKAVAQERFRQQHPLRARAIIYSNIQASSLSPSNTAREDREQEEEAEERRSGAVSGQIEDEIETQERGYESSLRKHHHERQEEEEEEQQQRRQHGGAAMPLYKRPASAQHVARRSGSDSGKQATVIVHPQCFYRRPHSALAVGSSRSTSTEGAVELFSAATSSSSLSSPMRLRDVKMQPVFRGKEDGDDDTVVSGPNAARAVKQLSKQTPTAGRGLVGDPQRKRQQQEQDAERRKQDEELGIAQDDDDDDDDVNDGNVAIATINRAKGESRITAVQLAAQRVKTCPDAISTNVFMKKIRPQSALLMRYGLLSEKESQQQQVRQKAKQASTFSSSFCTVGSLV